ncbi:phage tail tape measure protein [Croceicoccus estronivorus]|uniref:phage tail tape measure protein n=1 Tax=Croceicoccus estronivorus TaxID=1172626 RepID=UPI000829A08F|nr:phage tail tape measure protein [Croceicoccus estronivorus]OCC25325.1 phage tail tape measure protein [Croceicoccus estronivorus]
MNKNLRLLVSFATSDRLSGPLKTIAGLGETGSEKLARMKREARDMGRELRNVQGELKRSTGNVTQLINRERDLSGRIARTNDAMERQTRLLKINARADAIRQRGADLKSSGTDNLITGVAMAAPMVLASKQAMTFESAMADVRKVVDFDSPRQFRQMGDDITDMSTRIPMAAEGLAQIVAAAGRAGVARKELLTFTEDAAQMGIAFDSTAEDAGAMMAKWRTAFGMGQTEVRALADQINALTNKFGGNVGAVAGITTRIGALGKVAGLAAPQIAAMGQLMNSVGVEEEIAATGIKNMMLAMTKGTAATKTQQKAFAALGLDASNVANAMQQDAGGAITDILERLKKLPQAQQAATLTQLFGSESVAAIAPMLTNLDRLKQNLALVGDETAYAGSMQKEYLTRIATTEGAVGLATNALKAINITLGTMLLPTITSGAKKVVTIANAVRGWTKEHPGLARGLLMAWTAASGLALGVGALKIGLGLVLGPFGTLFRLVGTNGPLLIRLFTGIRTAALFMGSGLLKAGAMMLANPIVLVITAIVAAVALAGYLIYKHWDKISAAFKAGVAWVKGAIGGLPDWLKNLGGMMMSGLLAALNPLVLAKRLVQVARAGITAFKNYFGIKSPSRLMMGMGGYIADGLAVGIDRGKGAAIGAARSMATGVAGASMASASLATTGTATANGSVLQQFGPVTIVIHAAPGQSPQDIAEAVASQLRQQADSRRASHRSAFTDT